MTGLASAGAALWWAAPWRANATERAPAQMMAPHAAAIQPPMAHAATSAPTAHGTAPAANATPLAALIENTPPAAGPSVLAISPVGPAVSSPSVAANTPVKAQSQPLPKARNEARDNTRQAKAADKPVVKPAPRKDTRKAPQADRDVELLEAVMTHTERRQRP